MRAQLEALASGVEEWGVEELAEVPLDLDRAEKTPQTSGRSNSLCLERLLPCTQGRPVSRFGRSIVDQAGTANPSHSRPYICHTPG